MKSLIALVLVSMALGWYTASVTAQSPGVWSDIGTMRDRIDDDPYGFLQLVALHSTQEQVDTIEAAWIVEPTDAGKTAQLEAARRALAAAGETAMVATVEARIEALAPVAEVEIEAIE